MTATRSIPLKESKLKGLPHGITPEDEERMWEGFRSLRPRHHREILQHCICLEFGLARLLAGWIPACGNLHWKLDLPRFLHDHMQHARRLRERLQELPGGSGTVSPSDHIQRFIDAISRAGEAVSFVRGYVGLVLPALQQAYADHLSRCDEIFDAPTIYVLKPVASAHAELAQRGRNLLDAHPIPIKDEPAHDAYLGHVARCLQIGGGLRGVTCDFSPVFPPSPSPAPAGPGPEVRAQDPSLRLRDGFPTEHSGNPTRRTLREILYHAATEWQVIDPMCEVFHGLQGMPLEFFVDLARHIWDETRHSRMGFRRLRELGYDPIADFEWSHGRTRVQALEDFFAGLTLVGEACSFTRKRGSIGLFLKNGDHRSAMVSEVDCVDEQLHVSFGHKWITTIFKAAKGEDRTKESIARERRAAAIQHHLSSPLGSDAKEFLSQLDERSRAALVNTFSGFCGAVEFKMDLTVY